MGDLFKAIRPAVGVNWNVGLSEAEKRKRELEQAQQAATLLLPSLLGRVDRTETVSGLPRSLRLEEQTPELGMATGEPPPTRTTGEPRTLSFQQEPGPSDIQSRLAAAPTKSDAERAALIKLVAPLLAGKEPAKPKEIEREHQVAALAPGALQGRPDITPEQAVTAARGAAEGNRGIPASLLPPAPAKPPTAAEAATRRKSDADQTMQQRMEAGEYEHSEAGYAKAVRDATAIGAHGFIQDLQRSRGTLKEERQRVATEKLTGSAEGMRRQLEEHAKRQGFSASDRVNVEEAIGRLEENPTSENHREAVRLLRDLPKTLHARAATEQHITLAEQNLTRLQEQAVAAERRGNRSAQIGAVEKLITEGRMDITAAENSLSLEANPEVRGQLESRLGRLKRIRQNYIEWLDRVQRSGGQVPEPAGTPAGKPSGGLSPQAVEILKQIQQLK